MDFAIFKWRFKEGDFLTVENRDYFAQNVIDFVTDFMVFCWTQGRRTNGFIEKVLFFFLRMKLFVENNCTELFLMKVFIVLKFYCFPKFNNISSFRSFRYPVERLDFRPGSEGHFWVIFSRFVKIDRSHLKQFWPKFP